MNIVEIIKKEIYSLIKENIDNIPEDIKKRLDGYDLFLNFDWNKKQDEFYSDENGFDGEGFKNWVTSYQSEQLYLKLDQIIKKVRQDIIFLHKKRLSNKKLQAFEELIIPVLGNEVLIPKLSKFFEKVLLDPNLTFEDIERAKKEEKNIFTSEGDINYDKITVSKIFNNDYISQPAFKKFVDKNPEYKGVYNDWEILFNNTINNSLHDMHTSQVVSIKDLKKLYNFLINLKNKKNNKILDEVRYLNPNYLKLDKENPIKDNEKIRVFHGFYSFDTAVDVIKNGLSGKERAKRIYSYEYGNNPKGLFVTIDFNTASKNFSSSGIIIEFTANVSDLEAPVWVGGRSYFVQGEYTKSFKDDDEREQQRLLNRKRDSESEHPQISQSDRPELASTLFQNYEKQALFIGDLNPNMIKNIWYHEGKNKRRTTSGDWVKFSRNQFISKFKIDVKRDEYDYFLPNDDFSLKPFINLINKERGKTKKDVENKFRSLELIVSHLLRDSDYQLKVTFHMFPKQIEQLKKLKKTGYFDNLERFKNEFN